MTPALPHSRPHRPLFAIGLRLSAVICLSIMFVTVRVVSQIAPPKTIVMQEAFGRPFGSTLQKWLPVLSTRASLDGSAVSTRVPCGVSVARRVRTVWMESRAWRAMRDTIPMLDKVRQAAFALTVTTT